MAATGVATLLLAGLPSLPASAAPSEAADEKNVDIEPMDTTNLKLVEGLDTQGECLFRSGVYPAGGIGYKDSSLPYDEYEAKDAAFLTLRAQTLRAHPDDFMDLYTEPNGEGRFAGVVVATERWAESPDNTLAVLAKGDPKIQEALDTLSAEGVPVRVEIKAAPSMNQVCAIQDSFTDVRSASGETVNVALMPDPLAGQLQILAGEDDAEIVGRHASQFGKLVRIDIEGLGVEGAGRYNDVPSFNGGNRTSGCSNAFRINQTGSVTADHCPHGTYTHNGYYMGTTTSSLVSAKIDAMVIKGSSYSQRVWVGGTNTSSSLPAYGVYPASSLSAGAQVLVSGQKSGQGTISYQGIPSAGCLYYDSEWYCQIQRFWAQPANFIKGDSGGPVAAYDPANGRLIPLGIVAAVPEGPDLMKVAHSAYVTKLESATFLWGGASIG